MATVMLMHWPEVTKEQYEQARKEVRWETDLPAGAKFHTAWFGDDGLHVFDLWAGAKFHTAWFGDDGLHVFDLWDSAQDFQNFVSTRLGPATQRIGIKGQPKVDLSEAHAIFAPNV